MKKIFFLLLLLFSLTKIISQTPYNTDSLKQKLAIAKEDSSKVALLFILANSYVFQYADTSATYAKQGLLLAQKINYKHGEVDCLHMLCFSLTNLGDFTRALDFGFKALALSKSLRDSVKIVWSNNTLMFHYIAQEDYKEALVYGYRAQKLLRPPNRDTFQVSVVLGIIASVYEKINQLDSALHYAEKSYA